MFHDSAPDALPLKTTNGVPLHLGNVGVWPSLLCRGVRHVGCDSEIVRVEAVPCCGASSAEVGAVEDETMHADPAVDTYGVSPVDSCDGIVELWVRSDLVLHA